MGNNPLGRIRVSNKNQIKNGKRNRNSFKIDDSMKLGNRLSKRFSKRGADKVVGNAIQGSSKFKKEKKESIF